MLAFLISVGFLFVDAFFDNLSSVQHRKYVVLADLGVSGKFGRLNNKHRGYDFTK